MPLATRDYVPTWVRKSVNAMAAEGGPDGRVQQVWRQADCDLPRVQGDEEDRAAARTEFRVHPVQADGKGRVRSLRWDGPRVSVDEGMRKALAFLKQCVISEKAGAMWWV